MRMQGSETGRQSLLMSKANKAEPRCFKFPFHAFKSQYCKTKAILWKYYEIVLHKFKYTLNAAVWENTTLSLTITCISSWQNIQVELLYTTFT